MRRPTLRGYLRFLAAHDACRPWLDRAVPVIPQWRLSALPRYLPPADVERLIASCDLTKPHGKAETRQEKEDCLVADPFLRSSAPYRSFAGPCAISDVVRLALKRAEIADPPSRGTNLLRHSAATAMLRAGATLDAIGAVLRHRSADTTAHYAKVDVAKLRQIAQPWPGDASC